MSEASDAARATAEWWAGHVFGGSISDIGDGGIATMLGVVAGAQGVAASGDKRESFVAALAERVQAMLDRGGDYGVTLAVDYGPEPPLSDVAREVGISAGSFPWKTISWTYATHVTAALGYGRSASLVWQAPDWDRPECGQGKYGTHDREPWKCGLLMYHEGEHDFSVPDPLCSAQIEGISGEQETCLRPERHNWHVGDDWSSRRHAFVAPDPAWSLGRGSAGEGA